MVDHVFERVISRVAAQELIRKVDGRFDGYPLARVMQSRDQYIWLADVIHRCILAYLEREDFSAFETRTQSGIPREIGMSVGKRLELRERLFVAMKLSVCKRDPDPAG